MKQKTILLTILLIFLTPVILIADPIKTNGGILFTREDAQAIKNKIVTLTKKTNALAEVIAAQDQQITNLLNHTNALMNMVLNRIDFTATVLEKSEVYRELIKLEKRKSFIKGLGFGVAAGVTVVVLVIKGVNAIKDMNTDYIYLFNTPNSENLAHFRGVQLIF